MSEIILQQTRVNQGLPYYYRFVEAYPSLDKLAAAPEQEVLRHWQGLGYYSRARNMLKSAQYIQQELNGKFPPDFKSLKTLKGVGNYTAAAIASFAYHEKVAVVDGNVYRVLARIFGIYTDITSPAGQKEFAALANNLLPDTDSHLFNQGIMEFGALHCVPINPSCQDCIFQDVCVAKAKDLQSLLPVKKKSLKKRERYFNYLVLEVRKRLVLSERKGKDIWTGLYEFPLQESRSLWNSKKQVQKAWPELQLSNLSISKEYKHVLSHQNIHAVFWMAKAESCENVPGKLFTIKEIQDLPKPVLISRFLEEYT